MEAAYMPINTVTDKENAYIHTLEYHSAVRRDGLESIVGKGVNLEATVLGKVSQSQKVKHHIVSQIQEMKNIDD